jgi:hypothetical protein
LAACRLQTYDKAASLCLSSLSGWLCDLALTHATIYQRTSAEVDQYLMSSQRRPADPRGLHGENALSLLVSKTAVSAKQSYHSADRIRPFVAAIRSATANRRARPGFRPLGFITKLLRSSRKSGRGKRIRTSGPCLPKTVLYQAELFPDRWACRTWYARQGDGA